MPRSKSNPQALESVLNYVDYTHTLVKGIVIAIDELSITVKNRIPHSRGKGRFRRTTIPKSRIKSLKAVDASITSFDEILHNEVHIYLKAEKNRMYRKGVKGVINHYENFVVSTGENESFFVCEDVAVCVSDADATEDADEVKLNSARKKKTIETKTTTKPKPKSKPATSKGKAKTKAAAKAKPAASKGKDSKTKTTTKSANKNKAGKTKAATKSKPKSKAKPKKEVTFETIQDADLDELYKIAESNDIDLGEATDIDIEDVAEVQDYLLVALGLDSDQEEVMIDEDLVSGFDDDEEEIYDDNYSIDDIRAMNKTELLKFIKTEEFEGISAKDIKGMKISDAQEAVIEHLSLEEVAA